MSNTDFLQDIDKGAKGEKKFINSYFEPRGIDFKDVSFDEEYQKLDIDFVDENGTTYEVKYNFSSKDRKVYIEEYTNINEDLGPISLGWIHKSKADLLVLVDKEKDNDEIVIMDLNKLKIAYNRIKDDYELKKNSISTRNDNEWQSAFKVIPLEVFDGIYITV